jgi:hypothetical protein
MSDRATIQRLCVALLCGVGLPVAALLCSPSAHAKWGSDQPCVGPTGLTLEQQYGYSIAVVTPKCNQIQAGKRWGASATWIVDTRFEKMPQGFTTDYGTPLDDLRSKMTTIEYVVDGGSPYGYNKAFSNDAKLWVGELPDAPGLPAINTVSLGPLDPLPVGPHSIAVYWTFDKQHCDGFTASQGASCLPAGRTLVKQINFTVVDPYGGKAPDRLG